jgi:hypothetical protein
MKRPGVLRQVVLAGILTAIVDGLFSSVLSAVFYRSTVARLFQGVASTLIGPSAIDGGAAPVLVGVLMHFGVALGWSAVFAIALSLSPWIRRRVASPGGPIAIATVYGPLIWATMSLAIVPQLTHRPPAIGFRWWVQFIGHIPFVALPIVASIAYMEGLTSMTVHRPPRAVSL